MDERFDLQKYLTEGVEQVIKDALKATLKDPRESAFLVKFAASCAVADKRRAKNEREGLHVPSYLIASITSSCNLHCEGCYSRANDATTDCAPSMQLTEEEWIKYSGRRRNSASASFCSPAESLCSGGMS